MPHKNAEVQTFISAAGAELRSIRLQMQLTQVELAELLSFDSDTPVDVKTVSRWENGKRKLPGWVLIQVMVMQTKLKDINTVETGKGTAMKHKKSLINAALAKARRMVKG